MDRLSIVPWLMRATTAHGRAAKKAQIGRHKGQDTGAQETNEASKEGERRTGNNRQIVDRALCIGWVNHGIF